MPNHYNTLGGGNNNPIVAVNLQARPGEFVFQQSGLPYIGLYHRHQNGELMIGAGKMGVNHELKPNEIIVSANQTRGFADDLGFDDFDPDSFSDDLGYDDFEPDRKGGSMKRHLKKNQGGMLQGPSHEQGGIPAIVGGTTPIELEGGEYIINAQTVNAVGQEFLDELNSTQTTYHQGGFEQGELPPPSQFKNGGQVVRRNKRTRPVPTRRKGGKPIKRKGRKIKKMAHGGMHNSCPPGMTMGANGGCIPMSNGYKKGGVTKRRTVPRKMAHGGMHNSCPPGMTMQNGQCVSMGSNMGSGYRRGGIPKPRKKLQEGGLITRAKNTVASNVKNKQTPTIFKSSNNLSKGQVGGNIVGVNTRMTSGGPSGVKAHKHTIITTPDGTSGHTSTERGHSHKVVNGVLSVECTPELDCHSHNF